MLPAPENNFSERRWTRTVAKSLTTAAIRMLDYLSPALAVACGGCGGCTSFSTTYGFATSFSAHRGPLRISYAPPFAVGRPILGAVSPFLPPNFFGASTRSFAVPSPLMTPLPRLPVGPEPGWARGLRHWHDE